MPWNDQNGGGRNSSNGSGGPWGQPPRGPNGGNGSNGGQQLPPELADLLKKGQDQLRRVFPGGGGNGRGPAGRGPQGDGHPAGIMLGILALVAAAIWASQCIYVVQPDEVGVILRLGKAQPGYSEPGLHFALWPIDIVEKAPVLKENQYDIGSATADATREAAGNGIMLSGDQNLVDVDFSVMWKISDPYKYLFKVAASRSVVRMVAESSMREYVGRTRADEFRTRGRSQAQSAVRDLIQETLDSYDAGVTVIAVNLKRADPPQQVIDAFEEVQRAQQDQDKFKQDAQAYANKTLGDARGQAAQIRQASSGYKDRVIAEATGEAKRFISVLAEYAKAPAITRERLYIESMSDVLSGVTKVIIDPKAGSGSGVVPYLPLPQLQSR